MPRGLRALIIFAAGLFIAGTCLSHAESGEAIDYTDPAPVEAYIEWFHRNVRPGLTERAIVVLPIVMEYSAKYNLDPLLVACIISWESSWRPREGALKEVGYMQVMPGKWSKRFDLTTPRGQIEAGVYRLKMASDRCGSLNSALTHYASGSCRSKSEITKKKIRYRANYYARMNWMFRVEQ